jgi:hypothetical protein
MRQAPIELSLVCRAIYVRFQCPIGQSAMLWRADVDTTLRAQLETLDVCRHPARLLNRHDWT